MSNTQVPILSTYLAMMYDIILKPSLSVEIRNPCFPSVWWRSNIGVKIQYICVCLTFRSVQFCVYIISHEVMAQHDDVIKWKHFPRHWPFVRGIHRSPVNSPHKCQWRGALIFSLTCAWISGWVNNGEAGKLRRHCAHYDVIAMILMSFVWCGYMIS